jgi:hypothetical protein
MPATPDTPRMLLVTVAPAWLVKKIDAEYGDQLRRKGELAVMDTDPDKVREVVAEDEYVKIEVKVTPKGNGK